MSPANERAQQAREVERQVRNMLARSAAFRAMPPDEQSQILTNTTSIVDTMAQNKLHTSDPYAVPMGAPPATGVNAGTSGGGSSQKFTGGAQPVTGEKFGPKKVGEFGTGIATGVAQAGELLRQVNFPAFVAELVQGVFQAVVDASIQQMKAYGELVQSVALSLNDFKDQNVSPNQGRDHLVSKYPSLMQINVVEGQPRVGLRGDADTSNLPDFKSDLGLSEDITDLDDEVIEEKLVEAARNDLARRRQSLLATMVLMGINRIVVTDGKINAKLKFDFHATDSMVSNAQSFDYLNAGSTTTKQGTHEETMETGEGYSSSASGGWYSRSRSTSGPSNRWVKDEQQETSTPAIYVTSQTDTTTQAALEASAKLQGEVSLNFRTESFDLNKLASADEIFRLEKARTAGHGAPAPGGTPGSAAASPGTTPPPTGGSAPAGGGATAPATP
jgi:hypothetical protein